nr:hypothetical protein [Tanacetum cinerariifolium]
MVPTDEERVSVGKESANNGEWVKIYIQKIHTLLEMEDNDDRKSFLDYVCIDLNYVEEQRNNLLSKHRNFVHELNTCKEQLLVQKQAKLDLLTMRYVNTKIHKENQNLRNELKELTFITEAWLNSSNKVNQCISEQIPTQKKKILRIDQLTEDTSSFGPKDPVFVKSLADNSEMSITGSNKPKLYGAENFTLSNHDTGELPHSSEYVAPPSIDLVRPWFETIRYGQAVPAKGTLKKSLLPPRGRENVVPYTRFLSLLMMHKMKEGYRDGELTVYPTQVFSVNNYALKPNQPKEPPFTDHMLAICTTITPVNSSSKQSSVSNKEATKGGSSKAPIGSKTGQSKKRKKSSSAMDSNPSQPLVSTPVDTEMHKEDQQATDGTTSLGVISEERANPQLSSGMPAFNLNKPIYSPSFIIHSKSVSGNDASAVFTAEVDPRNSAPSDFVPQQQGMNKGTKNTSYDYLYAGKGASSVSKQIKEETSNTIKLEDLAKLVSHVQPSFKDMNSPEDDPVIVVDESDEDEEDEVHAIENVETKNTSIPTSSSPRRAEKNVENDLKQQQLKPTPPHATTIIPPIITNTTTQMQTPQNPQKSSSQPEEENIKKDKGREHVNLTKEHISAQKKIEEEAKAEATRHKGEMRKKELIDLLGPEVVNKYYNDKLQYDRYSDKMLNIRSKSRITNRDILTRKGSNYLESKGWTSIYKQIQERIDYLCTTEAELGINLDRPLSKQDPLDRLNDLANKKKKHADDIHDFFRANKRPKSSV